VVVVDNVVETFEVNGKRVSIVLDTDAMDYANPRDADNLGIMAAEGHRRYVLGDKEFSKHIDEYDDVASMISYLMLHEYDRNYTHNPAELFMRWAKIFLGATVVLPLYLYDHGGISMSAGDNFSWIDPGGWDSGIVGFILDTKKQREKAGVAPGYDVEKCLRSEVSQYDAYLQGSVYGFVIEEVKTCELGHEHPELVDSCWGFLVADDVDMNYLRDEAKAAAAA
jgi:hypothetical protein